MKKIIIMALVVIVLASSCATVPMASADLDLAAKTFTPPENNANLYILRKNTYAGGAISFQVVVDGKAIGSIAPGSFYLINIEKVDHVISVSSNENASKLKLVDVEVGKNYFFEVSAVMGIMTARVKLEQILEEDEGIRLVKALKRAEGLYD